MNRRTDHRREKVLAAIRGTEKSVGQVQIELGYTYNNSFYTMNSLKEEGLCHIVRWDQSTGNRPTALFIAGAGRNARLGELSDGASMSEIMSVDKALRAAMAAWANLPKETNDDQE